MPEIHRSRHLVSLVCQQITFIYNVRGLATVNVASAKPMVSLEKFTNDRGLASGDDIKNSAHVTTSIVSPHKGNAVDISEEADEAMRLAMAIQEPIPLDPKRDRRLLWKIDLFLMPVMCLLYAFQFMDKLSNSYALVLGLRPALHMKGNMFAWTGSAFYLGYLVFEYPAVRILQRFPVAKTVGTLVVIWGVIMCLHSVPNYAGFVALRTILGALESSVTPAFVILTSQYYRQSETFLRTNIWFASNGLGQMLGSGAIAYNVYRNADKLPIAAWKLMFIIAGILTIFAGLLILVHIPDTPAQAWFLNDEDKRLLIERIRPNQQGFGNKVFKRKQFKEAFTDPKTWLLVLFACASNIPNGGITNFSSILLKEGLGYSTADTMLMLIPYGAIEFVGCISVGFISQYLFPSRLFWASMGTIVGGVVACCMLAFSTNAWAALVGYWLMGLAPLGLICVLSCVSSNVAGHTKKTTVNALVLVSYCVGNLIGPQTFQAKQAPHYTTAKVVMVAFSCVALVALLALWYMYWSENKRRDANNCSDSEFENTINHEFADLTDLENPLFRYSF